jgi:hypothetical protein
MSDETIDTPEEPKGPSVPVFATRPSKTKVPRYMVVDGVFYAQTEEGEVAIKLKFKTGLVKNLKGGSARAQVEELLADRPELLEMLDEIDYAEVSALSDKLLSAYIEKQEALLGE